MAGYSYGGLEVNVTANTREAASSIRNDMTSAGSEAAKGISQALSSGLSAIGGLLGSVGKAAATGLGAASAAAIGFGVASFQTAARVGEMDASLRALAKANNQSYPAMQQTVSAIRKQGIEAGTAQQLVAQFTRNSLKMADATKLATVAQDAAVISGRNSTEVLGDLVHGITTQNSMVLRNAGLNVQAGQAVEAYAKSVGKASKELTDAERSQAVLNAVLESGKTVAGAYAEAMTEPGKVLRSFARVVDDIKLSIGQGLVKALGPAILGLYDLAKAFSKAVEPGGVLSPIFDAIGVAVARLVTPVTELIGRWAKMLDGLKPEQVAKVVDIIKQFGPALIIAGGALAAFTGAGVLGQLPIIGTLLGTMLGPLKLLGPTLLTVGKSALTIVGPLVGIKGGAAGAAAALGGLAAPVAAVVAGIVLLAATSAKFRTALVDIGRAVLAALKPMFEAIVSGVRSVLPPILDMVRALGDALGPALTRLAPLLQIVGSLVGGLLKIAFGTLAVQLRIIAPLVVGLLTIFGRLVELIPVEPIRSFANAMSSAIGAAAAFANPLRLLQGVLQWLADAIAGVVRWIFGGSPGLIPAFAAGAAAAGPFMAVISAVGAVFRALASIISSVVSVITGLLSQSVSGWQRIFTAGANGIRSVVTSGFNAVRSVVSSVMSAASSAVSSAFSAISGAARSGSSAVLSAVSSAFGQVRSIVSSAIGAVAGIVSSGLQAAVGAARAGGAAIMSGLQAGIQSAAGAVMSTISSVAGKVAGALSSALKIGSPSRLTIPMGRDLVLGLGVGWDRQIDDTLAGMTADLHGPHVAAPLLGANGLGGLGLAGAGATINVYPSAGMDERQLAAMVSRELAWATAGGV